MNVGKLKRWKRDLISHVLFSYLNWFTFILGTTARPTTLPITTGRTTKSFQTSPTGRRTTKQLPIVTSKPNGSTTVPRGPSNGESEPSGKD